jgi:FkbM family methyltransferase
MRRVSLADGKEMYVHSKRDWISESIMKSRDYYERDFLNYIKANHRDQKNIVDLGANIGNHSLFFKRHLMCNTLYCFEPVPHNFNILEKNLENFKDTCSFNRIALSNVNAPKPLYNSQLGNEGGYSLHKYNNEGFNKSFLVQESIEARTLDSYKLNDITMIKIDVENHEIEVLEGALETIRNNRPIIFIENLHHGVPGLCPDVDVHKATFDKVNYKRIQKNIVNSLMDLWVPRND